MPADVARADPGARAVKPGPWPFRSAAAVLVVGLLVTAALLVVSAALRRNNDTRLLRLRARDVAAVLAEALPTVQTPLASAAALADATDGSAVKFERFIAPYVGRGAGHTFVSASLWRVAAPARGPVVIVGARPTLTAALASRSRFFARAANTSKLSVLGLLTAPQPRLGYAFTGQGTAGPFAAYAETALPAHRYSAVQSGSAFADLNYALYLGRSTRPRDLLLTSVRHLPLPGRPATVSVPFGDSALTVVVTARAPLSGALPQRLPWAIAILGVLLSIGAAALTARLIARRRETERFASRLERVADENRRLYAEQRSIAQTLQRALLPDRLPQVAGLQSAALYEAGAEGLEIGGDWYDLIPVDDGQALLVVGDVSGRGLRAASTMAALRYAIHAYAAQGDDPSVILCKLSRLVSVREHGQLATVLCALIDVPGRQLTISSAGHLPPLISNGTGSHFVDAHVGLPVGVERHPRYTSAEVRVAPNSTVLAFTDGLVERRGESLDVGLQRLRAHVGDDTGSLEALLARLVSELRRGGAADDSAIAGVRWMS